MSARAALQKNYACEEASQKDHNEQRAARPARERVLVHRYAHLQSLAVTTEEKPDDR